MRLKQVVPFTLALSLFCIGPVSADTPTALSPALSSLNGRMHRALREVVAAERQQLGPLIMFEDGEIKLYRGDQEVAGHSIVPPLAYDQLKIIGHATFSVVIQVHRSDLSFDARKVWLAGFVNELQTVGTELASFELSEELEESQRALIGHTLELANTAQHQEDISEAELRAFAEQVLPLLRDGFTHSARLHVDLIHQQAEKLYALLTPEERAQLRGYFHGGRGAREGNLALQYVSWLVGERTGVESERVVFTEGVLERDRAMVELAKFGIERELAELVFGDPAGLHRDVLSEATRAYLATFPDVEDEFREAVSPQQ